MLWKAVWKDPCLASEPVISSEHGLFIRSSTNLLLNRFIRIFLVWGRGWEGMLEIFGKEKVHIWNDGPWLHWSLTTFSDNTGHYNQHKSKCAREKSAEDLHAYTEIPDYCSKLFTRIISYQDLKPVCSSRRHWSKESAQPKSQHCCHIRMMRL